MAAHIKPLILHAHATGPNPIKIAIALESLNIPFTVKCWDFSNAPNKGVKSAEFLKINENGRVPALEDPNTGVVSWESGACLNYVRRVYDNDDKSSSKIGPGSRNEQDIVDFEKWEYFLLTTLGPMTGQVNWFRHYHSSENDDALERYVAQVYRCYDVLEGQLKKSGGESANTVVSLENSAGLKTFPGRRNFDTYAVLGIQTREQVIEDLDNSLCSSNGSTCAVCVKWIGLDVYAAFEVWKN